MDMLAALRLQIEWGADEAIDAAPVDRTAAPVVRARPAPAPPAFAPAMGPVARARALAQEAATLDALRVAMAGFTDCPLATTATNLVFADGNPAAGLVLVGEAPGADEDLAGVPFVGEAGKFLDRMFASIGMTRADFLVTTLIPWRPPGNRPPADLEVQISLAFLHRHLALLRPRVVVTLGVLPARALSGRDEGIRRLRGRWQALSVEGLPAPVRLLPMLHPAFVQQTPTAKREAWADLLALRRYLNANVNGDA
jgi:DNA polymerase